MSKKTVHKLLVATWGDGEVVVELSLNKNQWERIARGDHVEIKGQGYWYDGDSFQDIWEFNGAYDELVICYGQPSIGDFSGQGYIGSISDVLSSASENTDD